MNYGLNISMTTKLQNFYWNLKTHFGQVTSPPWIREKSYSSHSGVVSKKWLAMVLLSTTIISREIVNFKETPIQKVIKDEKFYYLKEDI